MENLTKRVEQILSKHPHLKWMTKKNNKGFTLVELIVNMAIIGIIMVMVTTITSMSMNSFGRQNKNLDAVNLGNIIISTIENRISKVGHAKLERFFEPVEIKNEEGVLVSYKDLNGDTIPDTLIRDKYAEEYPVCLSDLKNYTIFFQKPEKVTKTNREKNLLQGKRQERKGKLYLIKAQPNAKLTPAENDLDAGFGIEGYISDGDGGEIFIEPLIDESFYHGYLVDVTFEYISLHQDPTENVSFINILAGNEENTDQGGGTTTEETGGETGTGGTDGGETKPEEPEIEPEIPPRPPEPDFGGETTPDGAPLGRLNCIKISVDIYDGNKIIHSVSSTITFIQRFFKMDATYGDYVGPKDVLFVRS